MRKYIWYILSLNYTFKNDFMHINSLFD
jgi:hypothetical protein